MTEPSKIKTIKALREYVLDVERTMHRRRGLDITAAHRLRERVSAIEAKRLVHAPPAHETTKLVKSLIHKIEANASEAKGDRQYLRRELEARMAARVREIKSKTESGLATRVQAVERTNKNFAKTADANLSTQRADHRQVGDNKAMIFALNDKVRNLTSELETARAEIEELANTEIPRIEPPLNAVYASEAEGDRQYFGEPPEHRLGKIMRLQVEMNKRLQSLERKAFFEKPSIFERLSRANPVPVLWSISALAALAIGVEIALRFFV